MFKQGLVAFCFVVGALTSANYARDRFVEVMHAREIRDQPVRVHDRIHDITREVGRLCWYWASDKVRDLRAFNEDAFLDTPEDTVFVAIMDDKGRYWSREKSPPPGHDDRRLCVYVDPDLPLSTPMRLRETIYFHGTWGDIPFEVPVVSWPVRDDPHDAAPAMVEEVPHDVARPPPPEKSPSLKDRIVERP